MTTKQVTNKEDIGEFQGTEINFEEAYHDTRKLMGTKGTDMPELIYNTLLLYVNAPEKWAEPYSMLVQEMRMRLELMSRVAF